MSAFFSTPEFLFFKKLQGHLELLHTEKNISVYKKYLEKCKEIARDSYKNIGWREDSQSYAWEKLDLSILGPMLISYGRNSPLSFCPDSTLFMSEDLSHWAIKHDDGTVVKYSQKETEVLRDKSVLELRRIHEIKKKFEGVILSGEEKREFDSKYNKKEVKRKR